MSDLDLFNTFIDLHEKLSDRGISIILGGGLGLYLKQLYLMENPVRTLIDASGWPDSLLRIPVQDRAVLKEEPIFYWGSVQQSPYPLPYPDGKKPKNPFIKLSMPLLIHFNLYQNRACTLVRAEANG